MLNTVTNVDKTSPVRRHVHVGDALVAINGHEIEDVLDYRYWSYEERLTLTIRRADGSEHTVKVKKDAGEDLGLDFDEYLMDKPWGCSNRCVFCFVDQLPRGMRRSLYFKDDDARLSFLTGSYITLTNLSEREFERICALRISPINVSVHTTNPELRARMMGNPRAADIMTPLKRLSEAGITMNCQIVCCPGWNDGEELARTMRELAELYPGVYSVSVVPVGLTRYRQGLTPLEPLTKEDAEDAIDRIEKWQRIFFEKYGLHFIHASDELYLLARRPLPDEPRYDGYLQLENGVGMLRLMLEEADQALHGDEAGMYELSGKKPRRVSAVSGTLAAPFIRMIAAQVTARFPRVSVEVCEITNDFFGDSITVSGLITGRDLIRQLQGRDLGESLLLPANMFKSDEEIFLDDVTKEDVEKALQVPVVIVKSSGYELVKHMLGVRFPGETSGRNGCGWHQPYEC